MTLPYRDYATYLSTYFPGEKIQKLTIDAGFSCPNRDGAIGRGGCYYCNNLSFSPSPADHALPVRSQIENGKRFFARKYPSMRFLAYFQSYTNTHGPRERLLELYSEALRCEGVVGLIIGTRPDCVDANLLHEISQLDTSYIMMEYGAESANDEALRMVNRGHTWADTERAVRLTREAGLQCGIHLINGLPGDSLKTILSTVDKVNLLRPDTVKFHQLQIIKGTPLSVMAETGKLSPTIFTPEEYIDLCCKIVSRLKKEIAIERFASQSPANLLIAPKWGLKNHEFTNLLVNELRRRNIRQGISLDV